MNTPEDRSKPINDASIDRLVDGDLDEPGRRRLLELLDDDPDGWRRCALAFLEDQAWRRAIAGRSAAPMAVGSPADPPARPASRPPRSRLRLAVAASMLVATFAAGLAVGGSSRARGPVPIEGPTLVEKGPASGPQAEPIREVGWINLVDQSAGESPPNRVPIFAGPGLDDQWLKEQPSSMPDYVRAQCEREGYRVNEQRRLVSVELEDGRRVSIPMDEVALEYVGQKPL